MLNSWLKVNIYPFPARFSPILTEICVSEKDNSLLDVCVRQVVVALSYFMQYSDIELHLVSGRRAWHRTMIARSPKAVCSRLSRRARLAVHSVRAVRARITVLSLLTGLTGLSRLAGWPRWALHTELTHRSRFTDRRLQRSNLARLSWRTRWTEFSVSSLLTSRTGRAFQSRHSHQTGLKWMYRHKKRKGTMSVYERCRVSQTSPKPPGGPGGPFIPGIPGIPGGDGSHVKQKSSAVGTRRLSSASGPGNPGLPGWPSSPGSPSSPEGPIGPMGPCPQEQHELPDA